MMARRDGVGGWVGGWAGGRGGRARQMGVRLSAASVVSQHAGKGVCAGQAAVHLSARCLPRTTITTWATLMLPAPAPPHLVAPLQLLLHVLRDLVQRHVACIRRGARILVFLARAACHLAKRADPRRALATPNRYAPQAEGCWTGAACWRQRRLAGHPQQGPTGHPTLSRHCWAVEELRGEWCRRQPSVAHGRLLTPPAPPPPGRSPGPSFMTCTSFSQARRVSSPCVCSSANCAASLASAGGGGGRGFVG